MNALSESLVATVKRDGHIYQQEFKRGVPQYGVKVIGDTDEYGTVITFKPDAEIFTETTVYDYEVLQSRIRELAFLNKELEINLKDERTGASHSYKYEGGIISFVEYLNQNREPLNQPPIYVEGNKDNIQVEIAIQYNDNFNENIYSFANNIHTHEGVPMNQALRVP